MIICKWKFTLAFKNEGTFKVAVKQLQVVVPATGNATFALSGWKNLLEGKGENDLFIHFQVCAAVPLSAVIISSDLSITKSILKVMARHRKKDINVYSQPLNSCCRKQKCNLLIWMYSTHVNFSALDYAWNFFIDKKTHSVIN